MKVSLSPADQARAAKLGPQHKQELGLSDAEIPVIGTEAKDELVKPESDTLAFPENTIHDGKLDPKNEFVQNNIIMPLQGDDKQARMRAVGLCLAFTLGVNIKSENLNNALMNAVARAQDFDTKIIKDSSGDANANTFVAKFELASPRFADYEKEAVVQYREGATLRACDQLKDDPSSLITALNYIRAVEASAT